MSARVLVIVLSVVLWATGASALTPVERAVIWTRVWTEVSERFVGFENSVRGMSRAEWNGGFERTLNDLVEVKSDVEFWRRLRTKVIQLNDGQTRLRFPPELPREYDTVPIRLITVEHRVFVRAVAGLHDLNSAGVRVGDELLTIEGIPARVWIERECFPHVSGSTYFGRYARAAERALTGKAGTLGHFAFARPDGSQYLVSLRRDTGRRSEYYDELFGDSLFQSRLMDGRILYLDFKSRLSASAEARALELLDQHPDVALILDLRDTHAGELPRALLARLALFPLPLGAYREYHQRSVPGAEGTVNFAYEVTEVPEEIIEPKSPTFRGNVVALVSAATSGPAEQFLQPLVFASRAVLVGSPTAGAGGQVHVMDLGSGATASITVREPVWEGGYGHRCGFPPGVFASPTAHGLAAGTDEVLDAALEYLRNNLK